MDKVQDAFNKLRPLVQYRDMPEAELWNIAKQKTREDEINVAEMFDVAEEKKRAKLLLRLYLQQNMFENVSEQNILKDIIYLEISQERLKKRLNILYSQKRKNDKGTEFYSTFDTEAINKTLTAMQNNVEKIIKFKENIGLIKAGETSGYDSFKHLIERHKKHGKENQGSRTLAMPAICPKCSHAWSNMILLRIRTDIWEAQKHPFFKDRILTNKHLMKLYIEKKLTADDVAAVLECSPDYVQNWLIDKWKTNPEYEEISKEVKQQV